MNFIKMWESIILSKPKITPVSHLALTNNFYIGTTSIQGWRTTIEDAHTILVNDQSAYFAVFDGHGGFHVADMVSKKLHDFIAKEQKNQPGIKKAMESAFLKLDMYLLQNFKKAFSMGTTAVVVLVQDDILYCANAGDSRAVAFVGGKAMPLSTDHRLNLEEEKIRVLDAEGFIDDNRVYGRLTPTRSFGDFVFKQNPGKGQKSQAVTAFPEVREYALDYRWEFVVMACDGVWEVMDNESVCRFIKQRLLQQEDPVTICEELVHSCVSKAENPEFEDIGQDNMTVILVVFLNSNLKLYVTTKPASEIKYICNHQDFKKIK